MNISDEAVEAAAKEFAELADPLGKWESQAESYRAIYRRRAQCILEAAAPHLDAGAEEKLSAIIVLLDPLERAASDEVARRRAFDATLKIRAVLDAK